MIVHLETNNLTLCLNHEYLKSVLQKNILKKSQKTRCILASVGKYIIKIEQEFTLE
jgi:secreted PhoX family phosphatase